MFPGYPLYPVYEDEYELDDDLSLINEDDVDDVDDCLDVYNNLCFCCIIL